MPYRRFDWHERIKEVAREYQAARFAVDRLKAAVGATPDILKTKEVVRASLRAADGNLEGTYLVRLFAAFEAALRSYDRTRHPNDRFEKPASVLIDTIAGRRGQGISAAVRRGAHDVRQGRNYWAPEADATPRSMSIADAQSRLQAFLSWLPEEWG